MIIRGDFLPGRLAVLFLFVLALTACGGGGGGGGDAGFLPNNNGNNGLRLTLFDANGVPTDTITTSSPGTLQVKAGSRGGVVVSASVDIGVLFPSSGTALTDSNGIATFQIEAGDVKGAGTVNASAVTNDGTLTGELNFQVGQSGLRLGYFDDLGTFIENQIKIEPENTLSAGGNAQLSVTILDPNGALVTTVEDVRFSSGCIAASQAVINPAGTAASVNGVSSTLYTAAGCSGLDEITASLVGASAQAFATLNVAAPETTAITFESAEPTLIVLKGTGGENRDETAEVVFTVIDGSGLPLQGVPVDFSLTTFVGGLALSTDSTLSGGDGQVRVTVSAGDVATVVRVIASTTGGNGEVIATVSDLITVTTGLPDQNSISLAVGSCDGGQGTFVVDSALNVDGLCRLLTVRMADKFNNPVVDGTAAVFTTEYGSIVGSCTTLGGNCSVEWTSQDPRFPTLTSTDFVQTIAGDSDYNCLSHSVGAGPCPNDLGYTHGGRSQILVHAIGEESFVDANGNGVMDEDERDLFANLPEAFLDQNEDGVYTPADPFCQLNPDTPRCIAGQEEVFIDFDNDELYDLNNDPAVYNGLLCPPKGDGIWCSRDLVNVRDDNIVVLNNDPNWFFLFTIGGQQISQARNGSTVTLYISDFYNNPPSGGSTVKVSASEDCDIIGPSEFVAPNTLDYGAWGVSFITDRDPDATFEDFVQGTVTVELTTDVDSYAVFIPCDGNPPAPDVPDCTGPSPLPPACNP